MATCPECGELVSWNSWFGGYICKCGWESIWSTDANATQACLDGISILSAYAAMIEDLKLSSDFERFGAFVPLREKAEKLLEIANKLKKYATTLTGTDN